MKLGLVPKIIIGIILGTLIGQYMPTRGLPPRCHLIGDLQ